MLFEADPTQGVDIVLQGKFALWSGEDPVGYPGLQIEDFTRRARFMIHSGSPVLVLFQSRCLCESKTGGPEIQVRDQRLHAGLMGHLIVAEIRLG
jgi:hypothetical protein